MHDEPTENGRVTQRQLYDTIQDLRKENKEDLQTVKGELLAALDALGDEFREDRGVLKAHITASDTARIRSDARKSLATDVLNFVDQRWRFILTVVLAVYALASGLDLSQFIH